MDTKVIYFDLVGGASGDMLLAALLEAGFKRSSLNGLMKGLGFKDARVLKTKVKAGHIAATRIRFAAKEEINMSFSQIKALMRKARISNRVKGNAVAAYTALAEIEEEIHGHSHRDFRFQHLGKLDAIIEITAFWLALEELGIETGFCSYFPLSNASPATMQLLKGKKVRMVDWGYETVTPTAAALLKDFAQDDIELVPEKVGYGAGAAGAPQQADLVRIVAGQLLKPKEEIVKVEVNLDDMNPQIFDHIMELLFGQGALDVYITPIIMKKNRPAFCLSVLLNKKDLAAVEKVIFAHTTTFGLRFTEFKRDRLEYKFIKKKTSLGTIQFRRASLNGRYLKEHPEYNDCKEAASKYNIPLIEVYKRLKQP